MVIQNLACHHDTEMTSVCIKIYFHFYLYKMTYHFSQQHKILNRNLNLDWYSFAKKAFPVCDMKEVSKLTATKFRLTVSQKLITAYKLFI